MRINKIRLGLLMASKGINFTELSKLSTISRATLSYINNGKNCRPEIVYRVAQVLDVDVTELIEE